MLVGLDVGGKRRVVAGQGDRADIGDLLRRAEERLLVLGGTQRVDQVPALVRVGAVAHRPRLGQRDDRVERVLLGHREVIRRPAQPGRRHGGEDDGDQRRRGERGIEHPPVAPGGGHLERHEDEHKQRARAGDRDGTADRRVTPRLVGGGQVARTDACQRPDRGQDAGPHQVGGLLVVGKRGGGGPAGGTRRLAAGGLVGEQCVSGERLVLPDPAENRLEVAQRRGVAGLGDGRLLQVGVRGGAVALVDRQVLRPVGRQGGAAADQQDVSDLRVHVVQREVQPGRRAGLRGVPLPHSPERAADLARHGGHHRGQAAAEQHHGRRPGPDPHGRGQAPAPGAYGREDDMISVTWTVISPPAHSEPSHEDLTGSGRGEGGSVPVAMKLLASRPPARLALLGLC